MTLNTPLYPGSLPVEVNPVKEIARGDTSNSFRVAFSNHAGTHIDTPKHFWDTQRTLDDYAWEEFRFAGVSIVECPKDAGGRIEPDDLEAVAASVSAQLLLIRTGFSQYRESNPQRYSQKNPVFTAAAAEWLRRNCPSLRAVGIDCISVSSFIDQQEGRMAHKILLDPEGFSGPALFIMEDMFLPAEEKKFEEVWALPFFIAGLDSAPCGVIGIIDD